MLFLLYVPWHTYHGRNVTSATEAHNIMENATSRKARLQETFSSVLLLKQQGDKRKKKLDHPFFLLLPTLKWKMTGKDDWLPGPTLSSQKSDPPPPKTWFYRLHVYLCRVATRRANLLGWLCWPPVKSHMLITGLWYYANFNI